MDEKSLVIGYTNLLHEYGVGSSEAVGFKEQYKGDKNFQRRANVLEFLIENRELVLSL